MKKTSLRHLLPALLLAITLVLSACRDDAAETPPTVPIPTAAPTAAVEAAGDGPPTDGVAGHALISEIMIGVSGNNNHEFVELYNPTTTTIDLRGYALIHQLPEREPERLYLWSTRSDLPPQGHVLLVRAGEAVGALPDGTFELGLFSKGSLTLIDPDGAVVDQVVWGEAESLAMGPSAPSPEPGGSIERLPGGGAGSGRDSDDSSADFAARGTPEPQNSGTPPTPPLDGGVAITIDGPAELAPGTPFAYEVTVRNLGDEGLSDVLVSIPLYRDLLVMALPAGAQERAGRVEWTIANLPAGESSSATLRLETPFDYFATTVGGYYAEAGGVRAYGPLQPLAVAGGTIPIARARLLDGSVVTVEGIATMYTEGYFAGTTGTKFYLEDASGGIQVYCPGGQGDVAVNIGDRVRVTGMIEIYRTSLEIIPCETDDRVVEVLGPGDTPQPQEMDIATAAADPAVVGELLTVAGTVTRLEEFSFSYELDIVDEAGAALLVYVDKLTSIDAEPLAVGRQYEVTGILESWDGNLRLMPRVQTDFAELFPPVLQLEIEAPLNAEPGSVVTYTYTVVNYTNQPLLDVTVLTAPPAGPIVAGSLTQTDPDWTIPRLEADGGRASVSYSFRIADGAAGTVTIPTFLASNQDVETVLPADHTLYVGRSVPVWAIQGSGDASPYVRRTVTTEGVITGIFPDLGGFWLQTLTPDGVDATSDGLFVQLEDIPPGVTPLDVVLVRGRVSEANMQTTLLVPAATELVVVDRLPRLPAPAELRPPREETTAVLYYESLEGMLVSVTEEAVAVSPSSRFGEYAVVLTIEGESRIMKEEPSGLLIFVDDGSSVTHELQGTLPYAITTGDRVSGLVGPLAYTFGNYKIQPIVEPIIIPAQRALPPPLILDLNEFSIATYNAENLFDDQPPHPDDDRPTLNEYDLRLAKTEEAILTMGAPTIIAFQEVENIGVLEDIAIRPLLVDFDYVPVLIEGDDSRGIDVGYLVRGDQAEVVSFEAFPAPDGVTSRHPLLLEVEVTLPAGGVRLFIINNHFTSMSGGELATEPRRLAQAAWNVQLAEEILATNPDAYVVISGDLNSFYASPPLDAIRDAGFIHVYEGRESESLYSYIFEGVSETLDHILVTPNLHALLTRVEAVHINADFPPPIVGDPSAQRASDHDPVVAVFVVP